MLLQRRGFVADPAADTGRATAIRLLRRWAAARLADEPAMPSLVALGREIGVPVEAAVALASVFELTEACLERPLQAECCCSPVLSADERAVLILLGCGSLPPAPGAPPAVPHGLPGALAWAVRVAGRLLGLDGEAAADRSGHCPFQAPERRCQPHSANDTH